VFPNRTLVRWLVVGTFAVAALVLGYIGLREYVLQQYLSSKAIPEYGRGWADILYYDVQLFVLGAAPAGGPGPIPLPLGIARFLAPATTAAATVEALRLLLSERLRRWAAARASGHAIVTGDGAVAAELAGKLRAEYRTVVLVSAARAADSGPEAANAAGDAGVRHGRLLKVSGNPTDADTLRAAGLGRADALYACTELSTTNAATVLRARELWRDRSRLLVAYAQVRDAEICAALRTWRIGTADNLRFRLDFFDVEDVAARVLLDQYLVTADGAWPAQVMIIGFGLLGRAVLREIARRPQPDGSRLEVRIRGAGAEGTREFLKLFPAVSRTCSVTADGSVSERPGGGEPTLVFVCLPDNDDALGAGLAAAESLTTRSGRVVICLHELSPFGTVLTGQRTVIDDEQGRLAVFGVIEEGCVPGRIREDLYDQLARAIHQAYLDHRAAEGDSPQRNPSMRPWTELPDDTRQANLAQAADIRRKLDAIDCAIVPESAAARKFAFTAAEIERLAEQEHERWMQERQAQGYVPGPDRVARQHPDLVSWDDLSESARNKDRNAVREIPSILQQAGFQIIRLPPQAADA
jgi:RyR domain-containing protein/TrkA family protein